MHEIFFWHFHGLNLKGIHPEFFCSVIHHIAVAGITGEYHLHAFGDAAVSPRQRTLALRRGRELGRRGAAAVAGRRDLPAQLRRASLRPLRPLGGHDLLHLRSAEARRRGDNRPPD